MYLYTFFPHFPHQVTWTEILMDNLVQELTYKKEITGQLQLKNLERLVDWMRSTANLGPLMSYPREQGRLTTPVKCNEVARSLWWLLEHSCAFWSVNKAEYFHFILSAQQIDHRCYLTSTDLLCLPVLVRFHTPSASSRKLSSPNMHLAPAGRKAMGRFWWICNHIYTDTLFWQGTCLIKGGLEIARPCSFLSSFRMRTGNSRAELLEF